MSVYAASTGHAFALGSELAAGGEGRIYEALGGSKVVAKLYHKPVSSALEAKLVTMIQARTADLESVAAWPADLLQDRQRGCVGFIMPRVDGAGVIDKLSHPAEQRRVFPVVTYDFVAHVAVNIFRAATVLHTAGCVVGDVNESNVIINRDGTIRFIDVDSFQITRGGRTFRCDVGTPLFTPPELQKISLRDVDRTPMHDVFGLAVLVFQLLMQGRHPFAGVPTDGRARTLEESIEGQRYAYSSTMASVKPPPGACDIRALGELGRLFEQTFMEPTRPAASVWMHALERFRRDLRPCQVNRRHAHLGLFRACPLCAMSRDPFPPADSGGIGTGLRSLSLDELLERAGRIPGLDTLASRVSSRALSHDETRIPTEPPGLAKRPVRVEDGIRTVARWGLGIGVVALVIPPLGLLILLLSGCAFAVAASQSREERAAYEEYRKNALARFAPVRDAARLAVEAVAASEHAAKVLESAVINTQRSRVASVNADCAWLREAKKRLDSALEKAHQSYLEHKRGEFLDRFSIATASIPDLGPSRKAMLASFGIETAKDVERYRILGVTGFGPHLASRLLAWRHQCESRFSPQSARPTPEWWLDRVRGSQHQDIANKAKVLLDKLERMQVEAASFGQQLDQHASAIDSARRTARTAVARAQSHTVSTL